MIHTPPILYRILFKLRTRYKKLYALPSRRKWPLAIILIILGGLSFFNPLINGVTLILAGAGLVSPKIYVSARTKRHARRTTNYHRLLVKKWNRVLKRKK